jgi:hypothetical protein
MNWATIGESQIGTSHKTTNKPCQDAMRHFLHGDEEAWVCIVVADGAGSASHSDYGANFVCEQLCRQISEQGPEAYATRESFIKHLSDLRELLTNESERLNVRLRDLASTLLVALVGPTHAIFGQIGDGAIIVGKDKESNRVVFWPEASEYANATDFFTDNVYVKTLRFEYLEERFNRVAVMTDGLQRLALDFTNRSAFEGFFNPLFKALESCESPEQLANPFREFLNSDRINQRTDDDKSIVLSIRKR